MANIVLDFDARIIGYQEELRKLQDAASKITLDVGVGKDISKQLESAIKLLDELQRHSKIRVSSDTGIDKVTDKFENLTKIMASVATMMQQVSGKDLNFSTLSKEIQDLLIQLQGLQKQTQEAMTSGMAEGIQNAITRGTELGKVFEELKDKLGDLTPDSAKEFLTTTLVAGKQKVAELQEEFDRLNTAVSNLENNLRVFSESTSFGVFNRSEIEGTIADLNAAKEALNIKTINQGAAANQFKAWIDNAATLAKTRTEFEGASKEIKEFLTHFQTAGLTAEQANTRFKTFLATLKEMDDGVRAQDLTTVFGTSKNPFNAFLQDDKNAQDEARALVDSVTSIFGEAFSDRQLQLINANLISGNINKAVEQVIKALSEGYASIEAKKAELSSTLETTTAQRDAAKIQLQGGQQQLAQITTAETQYNELLQGIYAKLEDKNQEIAALQQKISELTQGTVEEIKGNANESLRDLGSQLQGVREHAEGAKKELTGVAEAEKLIGKIQGLVQRWFSIYTVVRAVNTAIRSVISTVKELDKSITEIAIVTDMTQQDLWKQMSSYTAMARQYGTSIAGVYEVSQLYYQQGLQTADVMALTEQTLKMARISGLSYADATNYMTNAVRSFKMEMTDAQRVVDVYSQLAASSATSTSELAVAMSKTASSAEAVGSSFENTSAMMAVMIEATREAPENIGTAMKSIISRYGEMKADPTALVDSEGEEMSLNKVDKALKSVGITIQDTNHQFRDFDEVIMELAKKWNTIDKNTQRYIATIMAGNRLRKKLAVAWAA